MKMEGTNTISDMLMLHQLQIESNEGNKVNSPGMWGETKAINQSQVLRSRLMRRLLSNNASVT